MHDQINKLNFNFQEDFDRLPFKQTVQIIYDNAENGSCKLYFDLSTTGCCGNLEKWQTNISVSHFCLSCK